MPKGRNPDERLNELGHAIWKRVVTIESYHLAQQHGSANLKASVRDHLRDEEYALWGDLQTLFRGGVFPDELAAQMAAMEDK